MGSEYKTDYLVIGSGIAGLSFALRAAQTGRVIIITKKNDRDSNTNYAQGGIASALAEDDSPELHKKDTLRAGCGLCNEKAVDIMVSDGPRAIQNLTGHGVRFTKSGRSSRRDKQNYDLGREGGHSISRIVHARDLTGKEIERALLKKVRSNPRVRVFENHTAVDLITEHHIKRKKKGLPVHCYGAYVLDEKKKKVLPFLSRITLLVTGGAGQVYRHTTNPSIATADGIAMAYRAGAIVENLEFMQFHPTALYYPEGGDVFLISEALRGYGAELRNHRGKLIMRDVHPMGSLAPRDVVARAIDAEMKKSGITHVYLDVTHKSAEMTRRKFPGIYKKCLSAGIDITKEMIPVIPSAHYMCGGVKVDTEGRTSVRNLLACGETSCTGVHGANRLASNSLLEAVVFAERAFQISLPMLKTERKTKRPAVPRWDDSGTIDMEEWILISHDRKEIQQLMWDYVGIVRTTHRLKWARRRIKLIAREIEAFYRRTRVIQELVELRNIATVAELIAASALKRKESRGLNYNLDYPRTDPRRKRSTQIKQR